MSTVTSVKIKKQGTGAKGPWTMYEATLADGTKATGFDAVIVGELVQVKQDGKYLNYVRVGASGAVNHGKTEESAWSPPHQNGNGLDERQRAIIRQHSQSMALEVLKLKHTLGELTLIDLSPVKLRALADYFDNDVLKTPVPHRPVDIDEPSSEPPF